MQIGSTEEGLGTETWSAGIAASALTRCALAPAPQAWVWVWVVEFYIPWAADIQVPYPEGEAGIVPAEEGYTWQEGGFLSHQHDS